MGVQRSEVKMVKRSEGCSKMSKLEFHRTLQAKKKLSGIETGRHRRLPFVMDCDRPITKSNIIVNCDEFFGHQF